MTKTTSSTDATANSTFTYSLVAGLGSTDNVSFTIDATGTLRTASPFNAATKPLAIEHAKRGICEIKH